MESVRSREKYSVLVLDDSPGDAELVRIELASFEGADWHIETTERLADAQALLEARDYDVVVADLGLPDSEGLETVTSLLRGSMVMTPVIAHTGHATLGRRAVEVGADDYIVKGAETNRLPHAVRYAVSRANLRADLRAIVDANMDAMIVTDEDYRILFANPACTSLFGRSAKQMVGEEFAHRSIVKSVVELRIEQGAETRVAEMRTSSLKWEGQSALLNCIRDITDRVRAREYEQRLIHTDRLAAMGQLAAGVAHEVNNPASFALANLQQLEIQCHRIQETLANEKDLTTVVERTHAFLHDASEMLADSMEGVRRIASIVRNLKAFARFKEDELESVNINDVVQVACRMTQNEIRHRATLEMDLETVPRLVGHRGQLSQVVVNLLLNAAQAIEPGAPERNFIRVTTRFREPSEVLIQVEDSGAGIPESLHEQIFEPFFTTKPRDTGTGLGLAICAETLRKHDGDLRVESVVGKGTLFEITLPLHTGLRPSAPPESRPLGVATVGARILLIDDDDMVRRAFLRLLRGAHEVVEVSGGEEAIRLLQEDPHFDVILCDLMMPGVDGPAVYEAVARQGSDLLKHFVFISGGAFGARVSDFVDQHSPTILEKPISREALLEVVQQRTQAKDDD